MAMAKAEEQNIRLRGRLASLESRVEDALSTAVRTAEIGIGALTLGLIQGGRPAGKEVAFFGMPLELVTGLGLHGASLFGLGGAMSEHMANFADAGVSSYLYLVGRGLGREWRDKKGKGTTGANFADELERIAAAA